MACIFTTDGANARRFRYEVNAGNVGINVGVAAPMSTSPSAAGARASSATCTRRRTTAWSSTRRPRWWSNAGPGTGAASSEGGIYGETPGSGNAPCSWGTLEFDEAKGEQVRFDRMLDELVETGYTGTELGDWGYMPTDPAALRAELDKRNLVMLGAFVPVAMKYRRAHAEGVANAVKTARLLAAVASHARALPGAGRRQRHRPGANQHGRTRDPGGRTEPGGVEVFAAGANRDCARGLRRNRPAHGLPSPLRRLCRNAGRDRHLAGVDRSRSDSGWSSTPATIAYGTGGGIATWSRRSIASTTASGTSTSRTSSRASRARARAGAVGLLHRHAPRRLLRTGQGLRRFSRPAALARGAGLRRAMSWWSRTFCPAWARRRRARGATASICAPSNPISSRVVTA